MKTARLLLLPLLLVLGTLRAGEAEFPGLKAIMNEADWQKARLDRLDPADLQLINAAFASYLKGAAAPQAPVAFPAPAPEKRSLWSRFGLPKADEKSAAATQMMTARVTAMKGTNGFQLDNGQVWVGIDLIRDELAGREIGIVEGRMGSFLLVVEGQETGVRLRRVK